MANYGESTFFSAPAFGLIVGNLGGGKDKEKGGSGLISPFGIDLAIMLGWTFGIFRTFGFTLTPGIAIGRRGFIVILQYFFQTPCLKVNNYIRKVEISIL